MSRTYDASGVTCDRLQRRLTLDSSRFLLVVITCHSLLHLISSVLLYLAVLIFSCYHHDAWGYHIYLIVGTQPNEHLTLTIQTFVDNKERRPLMEVEEHAIAEPALPDVTTVLFNPMDETASENVKDAVAWSAFLFSIVMAAYAAWEIVETKQFTCWMPIAIICFFAALAFRLAKWREYVVCVADVIFHIASAFSLGMAAGRAPQPPPHQEGAQLALPSPPPPHQHMFTQPSYVFGACG